MYVIRVILRNKNDVLIKSRVAIIKAGKEPARCKGNALNCQVKDYIKCPKYVKEITWSNVAKTWIGF